MSKIGKKNIIIPKDSSIKIEGSNLTIDASPFLIDFGTAISIGKSKGQIKRFFFRFLKSTDLNAWIKHKYNRNYNDIIENDRKYYSPTLIEKYYRIIRKIFVKNG